MAIGSGQRGPAGAQGQAPWQPAHGKGALPGHRAQIRAERHCVNEQWARPYGGPRPSGTKISTQGPCKATWLISMVLHSRPRGPATAEGRALWHASEGKEALQDQRARP